MIRRRSFLQQIAGGASSLAGFPLIVPAAALGRGAVPPSDRLGFGFIGVGSMGTGHVRGFLEHPDLRVRAICDVREAHRLRAKALVDAKYGDNDCAVHNDFRELLARPDIDAVLIATPEHWHALVGIEAARCGKHMYYEKPMGMTVAECRAVRAAVRRHGVVFQFGTQQRSSQLYRFTCELARNGRIGQLQSILIGSAGGGSAGPAKTETPAPVPAGFDYDMWLGPSPWVPYSDARVSRDWMSISDYGYGCIDGAWGIHDVDFAQWANDADATAPVEVEAQGRFYSDYRDAAWSWTAEHRYANGVRLIHMDMVTARKRAPQFGIQNTMASVLIGSEGWIWVSRQGMRTHPESLMLETIGPNQRRVIRSDDHRRDFLDAIRTGRRTIAPVEAAANDEIVCQQAIIAMKLGRKLRWDPAAERFDDEQANRELSRPMRSPWRL